MKGRKASEEEEQTSNAQKAKEILDNLAKSPDSTNSLGGLIPNKHRTIVTSPSEDSTEKTALWGFL